MRRRRGGWPFLVVAAWLLALPPALARAQTTGAIFGKVTDAQSGASVASARISVRSAELQGAQQAASDERGRYFLNFLPPGTYAIHVEAAGYAVFDEAEIVLPLSKTIRVDVALARKAIELGAVTVTGQRVATVDQASTTTGIVLDRDLLRSLPLPRTFDGAFVIAPGSSIADPRVGTGFGGAPAAENVFLIEGLNTTNAGFGGPGAKLPPEFLEQLEVRTGGYMAEWGRATGAMVNAVLRSGGNDFHGDVFWHATGSGLHPLADTVSSGIFAMRSDAVFTGDLGFALGGPIVRDRLWFFVGFDPELTLTHLNRWVSRQFQDPQTGGYAVGEGGLPLQTRVSRQVFGLTRTDLRFAVKLTAAPAAEQRVTLSYFGDPNYSGGALARTVDDLKGEPSTFFGTAAGGTHNVVLQYLGRFFGRSVHLEATAGYVRDLNRVLPASNAPAISFPQGGIQLPEPGCASDPAMTIPTCPVPVGYRMGGSLIADNLLQRGALAVKASFLLPRNEVKVGADLEWNTFESVLRPTGGQFEEWRQLARRDLNGDGIPDNEWLRRVFEEGLVRRGPDGQPVHVTDPLVRRAFSRNLAVFAQDSVSLSEHLRLNAGVRWEAQQIRGSAGDTTPSDPNDPSSPPMNTVLTLSKNFAPRVGVTWDPLGNGRSKLYGHFGVYYESIPLTLGRISLDATDVTLVTLRDFADHTLRRVGLQGGQSAPIQDNLGAQYMYEWVAGFEYEVLPTYRVGVSYTKRTLGSVIEDLSVDEGNTFFIGNPGKGPRGADELRRLLASSGARPDSRCAYRDPAIPSTLTCSGDFPEAVRDYEAWTLYLEKRRTEREPWQFKLSYTLSFLRGNYSGLYNFDYGQLAPNITSSFDILSALPNSFGYLPNDHRHMIKLYGSYRLPRIGRHELVLGLGLDVESGGPLSRLGAHELYGPSSVFIEPRGTAGNLPWFVSANLFVEYGVRLAHDVRLSVNAVLFNFLNRQEAVLVDQNFTFDAVCPLKPGEPLSSLRVARGFDAVTGGCLSGSDRPTTNPDFGKAILKQPPISARLGMKLTF